MHTCTLAHQDGTCIAYVDSVEWVLFVQRKCPSIDDNIYTIIIVNICKNDLRIQNKNNYMELLNTYMYNYYNFIKDKSLLCLS